MTTDFENHDAFSIITKRPPEGYPSKKDMDHLTYLEMKPSIFDKDEQDTFREWQLVCTSCGHTVTPVSEKIEVYARHAHDFPYYGHVVRLGCFRNAPGCVGVERISNGYSWFRGYAWQIQLCRNCYIQLGWKYMSPNDSFYGLIFRLLREKKPVE
jgi:hypothetical protein